MTNLTTAPKRWYTFQIDSPYLGKNMSGPYKTRREAREMRRFLNGAGGDICGPVVMYKRAGVVR